MWPRCLWQHTGNSACLLWDGSQDGLRAGCPWSTPLHPSSTSTGRNLSSRRCFSQDYLSLPWEADPGADPSSLFATSLLTQVAGCVQTPPLLLSSEKLSELETLSGNGVLQEQSVVQLITCSLLSGNPTALQHVWWADIARTQQGLRRPLKKSVQGWCYSEKSDVWWWVLSSGWRWLSHTGIPTFSMKRNNLLGHRLSDLFYYILQEDMAMSWVVSLHLHWLWKEKPASKFTWKEPQPWSSSGDH